MSDIQSTTLEQQLMSLNMNSGFGSSQMTQAPTPYAYDLPLIKETSPDKERSATKQEAFAVDYPLQMN